MSEQKLKILYISGPSFLDMDLSLVKSVNELTECHYLMDLYPKLRKATALNVEITPQKADVILMDDYPEMKRYSSMLDLQRSWVINRTSNHPFALSNLIMQFKLLRFVMRLRPDVIHFNNQVYFTHFYLLLFRKIMLISIHDPFPHSGEEGDTKTLSAKIYQRLNRLLIRNHLLYNDIMVDAYANDRGIERDRICTASLGPYEFFATSPVTSKLERFDFLFFGRIQRYKGVDLLLEAYSQLIKEYPDATLTIAGSGSFGFDIEDYAIPEKNLRVINRFIPPEELADLIRGCKVVVCPYRDATQSGVVMTSYAFHKPVIVTDVGALPYVVEHGDTGYVVEANSVESLIDAMKQVLKGELSPDHATSMIEAIYHKGAKSWSAIALRLYKVYSRVFHKSRRLTAH